MNYKDLLGQEIAIGDFIVYAALWSRSAMLKVGIVTKFTEKKSYLMTHPNPDGIEYKVHMISAEPESWRQTEIPGWRIQNGGKAVTLSFTDRITRVEASSVPEALRNELMRLANV